MDINGRPDHIEDYLAKLHSGQWFGWSDSKNKVYANLIIHDGSKDKPSESNCTTGLTALQSEYDDAKTKDTNDKASGKTKLKNLGLTDDEIKALTGA
tara:strand:- start:15 stop:305 length:291 start_codon:yes stop_codon:yes gene_type:complete